MGWIIGLGLLLAAVIFGFSNGTDAGTILIASGLFAIAGSIAVAAVSDDKD